MFKIYILLESDVKCDIQTIVDSQRVEPVSLGGQFIGSVSPLSCYGNYKRGCSAGIYGTHISLREIMMGGQRNTTEEFLSRWIITRINGINKKMKF